MRKKNRRHTKSKYVVLALIFVFFVFLLHFSLNSAYRESRADDNPRFSFGAAIVDHLSLSQPNQTFIQTSTAILEKTRLTVDYYKGEEVTVEFYRNLPTHNYGLIILRVHSALGVDIGPPLALFTSEPYSKTKYVYEQLTDQLVSAAFYEGGKPKEPSYFGITSEFVKHSMNGRFQNTIIIMMGCNGLTYTDMAEAFIEKGAKVYISWSDSVLASHTDSATTLLLQHFAIEKLTLKEAVRKTFREIRSDPIYKSLLIYYPLEAGDLTIQKTIGSQTISITEIRTQNVFPKIKRYGIN